MKETFISRQKTYLMNQVMRGEAEGENSPKNGMKKMSLEGKNERRAFCLNENLLIK